MRLLFLSFLLTSLVSVSQESSDTSSHQIKTWMMPGASYGMEYYRDKNLQNFFGDSLESSFGQTNQFISIDYLVSVDYSANVHLGVAYILPFETNIFDTLNYKLSGYSISFGNSFKYLENKNFQMPINGGYRFGHMFLNENNDRMRNFFFDIYAEINPKIILFDRLVVFACGTLNWDITKQHWKSKTLTPGSNLNFKHTNGSFQIGLAWKFESISEENDREEEY